MKQKILFLMIALLPVMTAWADVGDVFTAYGFKFKVTSESPKTVELTLFDRVRPSGTLVIPATVNGYSVTSIGENAFRACRDLTSVGIPVSVTSIGNNAFSYCAGITSLTIPHSVSQIGDFAFFNCNGLTSVIIPDGVKSLGTGAFMACMGLKSISIPPSVVSIGWNAFSDCRSLVSVNIPEGVTSLFQTFLSCSSLESINVAEGNEHYKSVDGVLFDKNMTTLVKYPDAKKSENYIIPSGVTTLDSLSFNRSSGLKAVSIPASVTDINQSTLSACFILESITVAADNKYYKSVDGVLFDKDMTTLIRYPENKQSATYTIPAGVTTIGIAFVRCPGLTTVNIPASVTTIKSLAFSSCGDLTTVNIADGSKLTTVGRHPFSGCEKLTPVNFPPGVKQQ